MATVLHVDTRPMAAPADAELTALEREMVTVFADIGQALGLPKSYGEIYGLLYASAEPLSFADIETKLGLSKGSVSQGLKALREIGAVRRTEFNTESAESTEEDRRSIESTSTRGVSSLRSASGRGHPSVEKPTADGGRETVDGGQTEPRGGDGQRAGRVSRSGFRSQVSDFSTDAGAHSGAEGAQDGGRTAARSRDYYVPETELRQLVAAILREGIAPRLQANAERLTGMPELLRQTKLAPAERKLLSGRIEKLQGWRRKASGLLPWITKFLG